MDIKALFKADAPSLNAIECRSSNKGGGGELAQFPLDQTCSLMFHPNINPTETREVSWVFSGLGALAKAGLAFHDTVYGV
jgi:hypothetical protein